MLPAMGDLDSSSDTSISYTWDFWDPQTPGYSQKVVQAAPASL